MTPRIPGRKPQGDADLFGLILSAIQGVVQDVPILGDLFELVTGKADADDNDFASFINGIIRGVRAGATGDTTFDSGGFSILDGLFGDLFGLKGTADGAQEDATAAIAAATAADNKVTALLQGGVRTIYTSSTTWTPPSNLVKVGVLLYGGGRKGGPAGYSSPGGAGGGVIYAEFPATAFTGSVSITIGAGSSGPGTSSPTSFGSFLSSADSGGGQLQNSTLVALSPSIFPGDGGQSGAADSTNFRPGIDGGSTALATGGDGGISGSTVGKPGGNASVSGQYLAGGGGGGGGASQASTIGSAGGGGAGGFPGGGGGGAGRTVTVTSFTPGPGAPGLCAILEFSS